MDTRRVVSAFWVYDLLWRVRAEGDADLGGVAMWNDMVCGEPVSMRQRRCCAIGHYPMS